MSDMNETARVVLRNSVLDSRVKLREAVVKIKDLKRQIGEWSMDLKRWRDHIAECQIAAGDPIEIDPNHPEIK